jgi:hypothetical protein
MASNLFDASIISSLTVFTALRVLGLAGNQFGAELPSDIGSVSPSVLRTLDIDNSGLNGTIPVTISALTSLRYASGRAAVRL